MNNDDILMGEQTKKLYRVPVESFKISPELGVKTKSEMLKVMCSDERAVQLKCKRQQKMER